MAPPADNLREIGLEGFALIDKFYGRTNVHEVFPARQRRWVVDEMEEPAITSKEAAARFGGVMVVNYGNKGKPQSRWGRPIKP